MNSTIESILYNHYKPGDISKPVEIYKKIRLNQMDHFEQENAQYLENLQNNPLTVGTDTIVKLEVDGENHLSNYNLNSDEEESDNKPVKKRKINSKMYKFLDEEKKMKIHMNVLEYLKEKNRGNIPKTRTLNNYIKKITIGHEINKIEPDTIIPVEQINEQFVSNFFSVLDGEEYRTFSPGYKSKIIKLTVDYINCKNGSKSKLKKNYICKKCNSYCNEA